MGRRSLVSLALLLCAEAALAQVATTSGTSTSTINTSLPVAYAYVSSSHYIHAYKVWADGKLTSITGSPFPYAGIGSMAVTSKFLFGSDSSQNIFTYAIHSNGAISQINSLNTAKYNGVVCQISSGIALMDFSQTTLYYYACGVDLNTANPNEYLSFHIESTGSLQFLGGSGGGITALTQGSTEMLTKMGGNPYAFDAYCNDETDQGVIQTYKRQSNGNLIFYGETNQMPAAAPGTAYCIGPVAADGSNHLAGAVFRIDSQPHDQGYIYGPYYLASYSADSSGNLTTTSNVDNMPYLAVAGTLGVSALSISPNNKYVAVGSNNGFQVLHFNGGNPPTKFSGAFLAGKYVSNFAWDRAGHLYVLSVVFGDPPTTYLSVFNVNSSGVQAISGYPKYIANLASMTVLPLQ